MKVGAVQKCVDDGCFGARPSTVQGVKAASHVNEQPFGHEETIRGALNRLDGAKALEPDANFYVAIENGLFEVTIADQTEYFDLAWVAVEDRASGARKLAHSVGLQMPRSYVEAAQREGFDKVAAGHKLAEAVEGVHPQDPHLWLTHGKHGRESLLVTTISAACAQLS